MKSKPKIASSLATLVVALFGCSSGDGEWFSAGSTSSAVTASAAQTYVVLYSQSSVPADAATTVQKAGGALVYKYDAIGVVIARSSDPSFRSRLLSDRRIEGASSTARFGVRARPYERGEAGTDAPTTMAPSSSGEPLSALQWDMRQIHVPEAHSITQGSRSVIVGDIDTGVDYTHPDLAPNIDFQNSVSCIGGVPNTDPSAWLDDAGHGTHTAGTIAAAANGIGIVGVAPNVKVAAIKAGDADEFFFPEAVICAFMWAGSHQIDVTNNSYFSDPWLFNCRNDPEQHAIWKAQQRAVRYALQNGVSVIVGAGNQFLDLAHPTVDTMSPDFPPGMAIEREVTNACVSIPIELPGVVGVGASGNLRQKALYSNYGVGVVDVVAPGGDSFFQLTPEAPNGRVLSTWPSYLPGTRIVQDCSVSPCATYRYLQGTSMATPHVVGVAALIVSRYGKMQPGALRARLRNATDPLACPPNPFLGGTPFEASCQGGRGSNSFYGTGEVNALSAVSR
jgi:subtilisin family serine protease